MKRPNLWSQEFKRDPWPALRAMREEGAVVVRDVPILGRLHLTTTWDATMDFLRGSDLFAADGRNAGKASLVGFWWAPKSVRVLSQNMLTMDDPDHRRLRKLVETPFRRDRIEAMRPTIVSMCDALMDNLEASSAPDFVEGFARQLPLRVICEMLGLPESDRPMFSRWMLALTDMSAGVASIPGVFAALGKLMAYLRQQFECARVDPRPGLIAELVSAEADGQRLSEDELLAMVMLLFVAGHETTTHLLSVSLLDLIAHPDAWERVRADRSIVPKAVEELHRRNSPVQATKPRMARHDFEFHGVKLKQGARMMGVLAAANTDPARFPDPERLDLDRADVRHLGFGFGMHQCLGLHLARLESEVAIERIAERWPDARCAGPVEALAWTTRPGTRGLLALPLAAIPRIGVRAA